MATGRLGMHTAPARMIISAQTVAKTGRWIKKSTNNVCLPSLSRSKAITPETQRANNTRHSSGNDAGSRLCAGVPTHRHYWHSVDQELRTRYDDLVARAEPGIYRVAIPD